MRDDGRVASWLTLSLLLTASNAWAQGLDVQNFQPGTTIEDLTTARSGRAQVAGDSTAGAQTIYGSNLLLVRDSVTGEEWGLVRHRLDLAVFYAYGIDGSAVGGLPGMDISLTVPVVLWQYQEVQLDGQTFREKGRSSSGLGDPRMQVRVQLLSTENVGFDLALIPSFGLPLATHDNYFGTKSFTFTPSLAASAPVGSFVGVLDLGWSVRKNAEIDGIWVSDQLPWRVGAGFDLEALGAPVDSALMAEVFGLTRATRPFRSTRQSPTEWLASARYRIGDFVASAGVGGGLTQGYAAPTLRGLIGLAWARRARDGDGDGVEDAVDACPAEAEDADSFEDADGCPEADNDHDRVLDVSDQCPNAAEDRDQYEDDDGCPDPDNDRDGIDDTRDRCPLQPEDIDGYADDDGCPDLDNDGDGIPDLADKCPNAAEDGDGFQDTDGCPDPDNDGDGIDDGADQCADEPEDRNNFQDEDGCPDDPNDPDGDGLVGNADACPEVSEDKDGFEDDDGCPDNDNDGDGVTDGLDRCPTQKGDTADGCPQAAETP